MTTNLKAVRVGAEITTQSTLNQNSKKPEMKRNSKADANRENARKSTGPRTARGKNNSKRNALKHGLYSEELVLSEADKLRFLEMRFDLRAQMNPGNPLQNIAFDHFCVAVWRWKQAVRLEQREFDRHFQDEQRDTQPDEVLDVDPFVRHLYYSSPRDWRLGIELLQHARGELAANGYLKPETKENLARGFGQDFVARVEEWTPMFSRDAILMADTLVHHRDNFGEISDERAEPPAKRNDSGTKLSIDPGMAWQMMDKLLSDRADVLKDFSKIKSMDPLEQERYRMPIMDFKTFISDASRDLRRAFDWYVYVKGIKL